MIKQSGFDFVEASVDAYRYAWQHSIQIARIAWPAFALKFILFLFVVVLGLQNNYLRQGLLFIPAYFAEGWFIAVIMRMAIKREAWPASLTGDKDHDQSLMLNRTKDLKQAVGFYVLIKLLLAFTVGMIMMSPAASADAPQASQTQAAGLEVMLVAGILVAVTVWCFRYLWLYVPPACGYSAKAFLKRINRFVDSFKLMGIWLITFAPIFVLLMFVTGIIEAAFPGETLEDGSMFYYLVLGLSQSAIDLFVSMVSSLAVGYAVYEVMEGKRLS